VAQAIVGAPDKRSLSGIRFSDLSYHSPASHEAWFTHWDSIINPELARRTRGINTPRRAKDARLGHPMVSCERSLSGPAARNSRV